MGTTYQGREPSEKEMRRWLAERERREYWGGYVERWRGDPSTLVPADRYRTEASPRGR